MTGPTGERMLPDHQRGELVHAEHLARYKLAAQYATGKHVLDAACGEGYGSQMLLDSGAESVTGVDIDQATVTSANERYDAKYIVGDASKLPFDDNSFDLIVSFETIEHLEDPIKMLDEFARVLAPSGAVIISTPNALEYKVDNEFHVKEFTPKEFDQLLTPRFGTPRFVYQQTWLLSALLGEKSFCSDDDSKPIDLDIYKSAVRKPGQELYLVALCGDLPAPRELAHAADVYEANKLLEWIDRANHAEELLKPYLERCEKAEALLASHIKRCEKAEALLASHIERCEKAEALLAAHVERGDEAERSVERLERKIEVLERRGVNKLLPLYREIKRRRTAD